MYVDHPGKPGEHSQDFELNLASIIDCFTVLITYLLVSAAFISIGVFDVSVALNGGESQGQKAPPVTLTVALKSNHEMRINMAGTVNKAIQVNPKDGTWDYATLDAQLQKIHTQFPALDMVVLAADQSVVYKDVVKGIEAVKKSVPAVYIGDQEVN